MGDLNRFSKLDFLYTSEILKDNWKGLHGNELAYSLSEPNQCGKSPLRNLLIFHEIDCKN